MEVLARVGLNLSLPDLTQSTNLRTPVSMSALSEDFSSSSSTSLATCSFVDVWDLRVQLSLLFRPLEQLVGRAVRFQAD